MNNKSGIYNVFLLFSLFLVLLFICFCVYTFAQNNIPIFEDCNYFIFRKNDIFNQFFFNVYHGRYLSNIIIIILTSFLPKLCGLHPITFFQTVAPVIKGLFLFILFFQIGRYYYRNRTYDFILPFIILSLYVMYQLIFAFTYEDIEYAAFYGFTFPFILFNLFWFQVIKLCYDNDKKPNIFLLTFFAFIVGISTEFTNITSLVALLVLFVLRKSIRKNLILPIMFVFSGLFLYYANQGSLIKSVLLDNKGSVFVNWESFKQLPLYIKPFLNSLFNISIHEYGVFLFLIVILTIIITLFQEKKFDKILVPFSLLSGCLVFSFALIGNPENAPSGSWLFHFDVINQYRIFYLIIFLYLLNLMKTKRIIKDLIVIIFFVTSICFISLNNMDFLKEVKSNGLKTAILNVKLNEEDMIDKDEANYFYHSKNRYIFEKINIYNLKHNLPVSLVFNPKYNIWVFYTNHTDYLGEGIYMNYVYGLPIDYDNFLSRRFDSIEEAYEQYLKDGGSVITPEEAKRADFQNLLITEKVKK